MNNTIFKDKFEASEYIMKFADKNKLTLFEAVLQFCEQREIDIDDFEKYITPTLKQKIQYEFKKENGVKNNSIEGYI